MPILLKIPRFVIVIWSHVISDMFVCISHFAECPLKEAECLAGAVEEKEQGPPPKKSSLVLWDFILPAHSCLTPNMSPELASLVWRVRAEYSLLSLSLSFLNYIVLKSLQVWNRTRLPDMRHLWKKMILFEIPSQLPKRWFYPLLESNRSCEGVLICSVEVYISKATQYTTLQLFYS